MDTLHPDFFVIPCNTAHFWFDQLQALTDTPILNMPEETVKAIVQEFPAAKKVGLLGTPGTIADRIYDQQLLRFGLQAIHPTASMIDRLHNLIFDQIKGQNFVDGELFHDLIREMIQLGAEVVILGCTELSLANYRNPSVNLPIVDSQSILVDRTIQIAEQLQHDK